MSSFPLPPVPNFRIVSAEPGHVRLIWADYPPQVSQGHNLKGFRIYRSENKDELGERIADESQLGPSVFQFDDTNPLAGPERGYVCVAVEKSGFGEAPFGETPFGEPDNNGYGLLPYNSRPFGAPLRGWGQVPFGLEGYGY